MHISPKILQDIQNLPRPAIIALSGFGGAGKSTAAAALHATLNAPVISVDSFWKDTGLHNYSMWEIVDYKRLEDEILVPFIKNVNPIPYGDFDHTQNTVTQTTQVSHDGLLIVEGVGLLRPELLKYFAYTIWVDIPLEEAMARGKKRDREEYNAPKDELWDGIWKENDKLFFETYRPDLTANAIIQNTSL